MRGRNYEHEVFLSYDSSDRPMIEEIARTMTKHNIKPWLDEWDLTPGDLWQEGVEKALNRCCCCAIFIGANGTGPWQNMQMRMAIRRRIDSKEIDFRVIPVVLPNSNREKKPTLPGFLENTISVEFRDHIHEEDTIERLVLGIKGPKSMPVRPNFPPEPDEPPYRGLRTFDIQHDQYFMGRENLTQRIIEKIDCQRAPRFQAIMGPSGSGKSSLARAGVAARIKKGVFPGSKSWPICFIRPGSDPLESLAVGLSGISQANCQRHDDIYDLINELSRTSKALHVRTRLILANAPEDDRVLYVVDQFEETFSLCQSEALRHAFISNLMYASNAVGGRSVVLLTMRADFYGNCVDYPDLVAAIESRQTLVRSMGEDELHQAVAGPAHAYGYEFEPGLVDMIVKDFKSQPGYLPLLQHALLELWNHREGKYLSHSVYHRIGGVEKSLERRAENIYQSLSPIEKQVCQRVYLQLVRVGADKGFSKRRALLSEMLKECNREEIVRSILQQLSGPSARLVTIEREGDDVCVEMSHEALIMAWPRLKSWLDEDKEFLFWLQRFRDSYKEWSASEEEPSALLYGIRLANATDWLSKKKDYFSQGEVVFIEESKRRKILQRRKKWITVLAAFAFAVLAIFFATLSYFRSHDAQFASRQSRARELAGLANNELSNSEDDTGSLAVLLARESVLATLKVDGYVVPEAEIALRRALKVPFQQELGAGVQNSSIAHGPKDHTLLTTSEDGVVQLWSSETGILRDTIYDVKASRCHGNRISEKILCVAIDSDVVTIVDLKTRDSSTYRGVPTEGIRSIEWNSSGTRVAIIDRRGELTVRDSESGEIVDIVGIIDNIEFIAIAWDPTRPIIAIMKSDESIVFRDIKTKEFVGEIESFSSDESKESVSRNEGRALSWSVDGRLIAYSVDDGFHLDSMEGGAFSLKRRDRLIIADLALGRIVASAPSPAGEIYSLEWSPTGEQLLIASEDEVVNVFGLSGERLRLVGHRGEVTDATWVSDRMIASLGSDRRVKLWKLSAARTSTLKHEDSERLSAGVFLSETEVATGSFSGSIQIWDLSSGEVRGLGNHSETITFLSVGGNDGAIASSGLDSSANIWSKEAVGFVDSINSVGAVGNGIWIASLSGSARYLLTATAGLGVDKFVSPTASSLMAAGVGVVQLWDLGNRSHVELEGHEGVVHAVAWSPDDSKVITGSEDHTARIWDRETGKGVRILKGHGNEVISVAWKPLGDAVATAGKDKTIRIWDAVLGSERLKLIGHTGEVEIVQWHPTEDRLVSVGADRTIRFWDDSTGLEIHKIDTGVRTIALQWSTDGLGMVVLGQDWTFTHYDLSSIVPPIDELVSHASIRIQRRPPTFTDEEAQRFSIREHSWHESSPDSDSP